MLSAFCKQLAGQYRRFDQGQTNTNNKVRYCLLHPSRRDLTHQFDAKRAAERSLAVQGRQAGSPSRAGTSARYPAVWQE